MTEPALVFVNDRAVRLPAGAPASEAVARSDSTLADHLRGGSAYLTDGRGIRLAADTPVYAGQILRVVVSARAAKAEGNAHP